MNTTRVDCSLRTVYMCAAKLVILFIPGATASVVFVGLKNNVLFADVIYTTDSVAYVLGDTQVDQDVPKQISASDLLHGIIPSSAHNIATRYRLSDGTGGEMDFDPDGRVALFDNTGTYQFTFGNLGGVDIGEIRAFSVADGDRAKQDFDVAYSVNGVDFIPIISPWYDSPNASNLTRIFDDEGLLLATNVSALRFTIRPVGFSFGNKDQHTSYVEFDAFSTSPVPEPGVNVFLGLLVASIAARYRRRKLRKRQ